MAIDIMNPLPSLTGGISTSKPVVSSPSSPVVKSPVFSSSPVTTTKPTTPVPSSQSAGNSRSSSGGGSSGISRALNVLNPFSNDPIALVNPINGGIISNDVGAPVRSVVRIAEAVPAAAGALALSAWSPVAAAGTAATAAGAGAFNWFNSIFLGAAAGGAAGLLFSSDKQPMSQVVTPTQPTTGTQQVTPNWTDNSYKAVFETQNYTITGSPYASINGSQSASLPATMNTSAGFSQIPTQDTSAEQTSSNTNWILIAAIAAGAYVLSRK